LTQASIHNSEEVRDALPSSWKWAPIQDVAEVVLGQSPPSSSYNNAGVGLPFFQGKAEFGALYPTVQKWCSQPSKVAEEGDVLISVRAPVGPTNIAPSSACIGRGLAAIRGSGDISTKFVLYALRTYENELASKATGTTFAAITGNTLRSFDIPVPPLAEQGRIVEKIEELFTKLDAGVRSLEQARAQLKSYRRSVLKAAVEGELSREWREAHKDEVEPASELLERILRERREKFAGKKYKEPASPAPSGLATLPEGWEWASLEQLSWDSGYR
jgi:type I restriction enzyme S subunit